MAQQFSFSKVKTRIVGITKQGDCRRDKSVNFSRPKSRFVMDSLETVLPNLIKGERLFSLLAFLRITAFFWPEPAVVRDGSSYDYIIVGGGTAGCVIASELSKWNASVLLIEAGDQPPLESDLPGLFPLLKGTHLDWNFTSVYDQDAYRYHRGKVMQIQQGKVLGGSGQVGYMIYGKGFPKDYQRWAEITNDSSWEYKNLCNIFKEIEKVTDEAVLHSPDIMFHGTKGKIKIKKYRSCVNEKYFEAYRELGHKVLVDINPNNSLGYTNAYFNIHCRGRQSTAFSYLSKQKNNPNLSVMYNALVTKIIFSGNRATGVEIYTESGSTINVRARREIIISAGVIKSPQLLLLSGIGPRSHLNQQDIDIVADLPVGKNLQDQPVVIMTYRMGETKLQTSANPYEFPVAVVEGNVAMNKDQDHPDYQILSGVMNYHVFFEQVCLFVFNFNYDVCDYITNAVKGRQIHYITHSLLHPYSRGEIYLKNKDPKEKPVIIPGYYSNKTDLDNHARYMKDYNQILKTKFFRSADAELVQPSFFKCGNEESESIEYFKCFAKAMSTTLNMLYGTCAMGSVVNSKLQVIGIENLRVADASVIPSSVGGPILSSVVVIAKRLVEFLKADL